MRPDAQYAEAIAVLELFEMKLALGEPGSINGIMRRHFSSRRYAGSGDRRTVGGILFDLMRKRMEILERLDAVGATPSARMMMALYCELLGVDLATVFTGEGHGMSPLATVEQEWLTAALAINSVTASAKHNMPEWLLPLFSNRLGQDQDQLMAMNRQPDLQLRVNSLKATQDSVLKAFREEDIESRAGDFTPTAIIVAGRPRLGNHRLMRDGLVEIQDQSGQIACHLVAARPSDQVVDLCAGAGGKALAMAAMMGGKGQIYAFDVSEARLKDLPMRADRAKARNIQWKILPEEGPGRAELLAPLEGLMDRVVIDAPCTGSGSIRRHPDLAFRLQPGEIAPYAKLQLNLLAEGAGLVKPGGRLVYMTCSLFREENEAVAEAFLAAPSSFKIIPYQDVLADHPLNELPRSHSSLEGALLLTPGTHDTDGFFVVVFERTL